MTAILPLCLGRPGNEDGRRAVAIKQINLDNNNKYIKLVRRITGARGRANLFPFGCVADGAGSGPLLLVMAANSPNGLHLLSFYPPSPR